MSTSDAQSAGASTQDVDGVIRERLRSLKNARSGYLGNVTKLEGELDNLIHCGSPYQTALDKKQELDEAMFRCTEHSKAYLVAIPDGELYQDMKIEAQNKCRELEERTLNKEKYFEKYLQETTDREVSVSVVGDMQSVASARSSTSSIRRRRELVKLQQIQSELEAKLRLQQAENLAQIKLSEEKAKLQEQQMKVSEEKAKLQE